MPSGKLYNDSFEFGANVGKPNPTNTRKKAMAKKATRKRGPNTNIDADAFTASYADAIKNGLTSAQLAEKLGITLGTLQAKKQAYAKKYGWEFAKLARSERGPKYTDAQLKAFAKRVSG